MTSGDTKTESWAPRTRATYTADWALFTDWCATEHQPLPANPDDVLAFLAECPAARPTLRRRVIAIDHHHFAGGHSPPGADPRVRDAVGRPPLEERPIDPGVRSKVDTALRMLPSRGWTGGLFGQRDRCLLVLSQLAGIPHKRLARLVAGDITVAAGVAAITVAGQTGTVEAVDDPVLCGPCAIVRWLCTHRVIVTKIATRAIADHLRTADQLTSASPHVCRESVTLDGRAAGSALLAPINQWGHAPFPLTPMSPHAVSRQARDLLDGTIAVHRDLDVVPATDEPPPAATQQQAVTAGHTKQRVRAAWDRRRSDIADLACVADELADVDHRVGELDRRISELLVLAMKH